MFGPAVSPVQATRRYGGLCRLGTPERKCEAAGAVSAAKLDKVSCDALNLGNLPDAERVRSATSCCRRAVVDA